MIEIQGLKKSYGTKLVLDGVHLTVPDIRRNSYRTGRIPE